MSMIIQLEIEKQSFPIYFLPLAYLALALLFPDRWKYAADLVLALVLFLGSYGLGKRLSYLFLKITDQTVYFPLGLGTLLAAAYAAAAFTTKPLFFYSVWGVLGILALLEVPVLTYRIRRTYLWGAPFVLLAFWSTLTPVTFFDSLVYHLGLPYQYLADGRMAVLPHHWYSSFPPFDQVLNLLFVGMGLDNGIKVFSVILYFQILGILMSLLRWILHGFTIGGNGRDHEYESGSDRESSRTELLVLLMLLFPSAWILIHLVTAELLVGLFFCSGIALLVKEYEGISLRIVASSALLLAFSAWSKANVLLYIFLIPLLWVQLCRWRPGIQDWKNLWLLCGMIFLFLLPLFARNFILLGDPLYPAFAGILGVKNWSPQQDIAWQLDHTSGDAQGWTAVLLTPIKLTFSPVGYGSAAPIGLVFLIAILVYPVAKRERITSKILLYVLFCYLAWLFVFRDFRQFFPAFLLIGLMCYSSFFYLYSRYRSIFYALIALSALVTIYFLFPIYRDWFPLIHPNKIQQQYLREHLDYYGFAEKINQMNTSEKILTLGETRAAYIKKPMVVSSAFDQNPFFLYLSESKSADELLVRLRAEKIGYLFCNWSEYRRLALKCRLLPVDVLPRSIGAPLVAEAAEKKIQLPELSTTQKEILQTFLSQHVSLLHRQGDFLFLYQIKNSP